MLERLVWHYVRCVLALLIIKYFVHVKALYFLLYNALLGLGRLYYERLIYDVMSDLLIV